MVNTATSLATLTRTVSSARSAGGLQIFRIKLIEDHIGTARLVREHVLHALVPMRFGVPPYSPRGNPPALRTEHFRP